MVTPRLRTRLCHGTAVAAALALTPQTALAQALPTGGLVQAGAVAVTAGGANTSTVSGTGTLGDRFVVGGTVGAADVLNVAIGSGGGVAGQSAIVDWTTFDIGSTAGVSNTVNFAGAGGLAYSVLNRVDGGSPTTIAGSLTGGGNGTIWVINEAGLSFAGSASVTNLSGLVASSLGVTNAAFGAALTTGTQFTGAGIAAVTIAPGATITPGTTLLLVAPKLSVTGGTLSATNGDAGFVVASDATVRLSASGIVNVRIAAGTDFAGAGGSVLGATVNGQRVLVAAASNADIADALLNITGSVTATSAVATKNGIFLGAGRDVAIDAGESISFDVANPAALPDPLPGARSDAGIIATGTLTTVTSGSVVAAASGALGVGAITSAEFIALDAKGAVGAGALTAGAAISAASETGNVTLASADAGIALGGTGVAVTALAGTASITGAVTASDDIVVRGGAVVLGGAAGVTQSTTGNVLIQSTSGGITANSGLSLIADSGGADGRLLVLDSAAGIAGAADLRAGSTAAATATNRSNVLVRVGANADLSLGAIDADRLATTTAVAPVAIGDYAGTAAALATTGSIALGDVTSFQSIDISTADGTPGAARTLSITGASSQGSVTLAATTLLAPANSATLDVGNVSAFGGAATLTGTTAITRSGTTRAIAASTNVTLNSDGAVTVDAIRAGGAITSDGDSGARPVSFTGGSLEANGTIGIDVSGAIDLGTVATRRGALVGLATFTGGNVADAGINLLAATGTLDLGSIAATGAVTVQAGGAATITGDAAAGVPGGTAHDYRVIGGSVALGGVPAATQQATGDVTIIADAGGITTTATLTIVADTLETGNRRLVLDSTSFITGGASLRAGSVAAVAGTRSDVVLKLGSGGALALGDVTADQLALTLAGPAYAALVPNDLTTTGAITLGAVDTVQAARVGSTGGAGARNVSLGGITSATGAVEVFSTGGDVAVGIASGTGATLLADAGTLTAGNVTARTGAALLRGGTTITRPATGGPFAIAALTGVDLRSDGGIAVDAVRAGGAITVRGIVAATPAGSLTAASLRANGAITIDTTAALDVSGGTIVTERKAINAGLSAFDGGDVAGANLTLTSGGALTAAGLASTGSIALTATGAATVSGTVTAGDATSGGTTYAVTGSTVTLGGAGPIVQAAKGAVTIRSTGGTIAATGALALQANAANANIILDSAGAITGAAALTAGTSGARGLAAIRLGTSTDVVSLGDVTALRLVSTDYTNLVDPSAGYTLTGTALTTSGAITLGVVSVVDELTVATTTSGNVVAGAVASATGNVSFTSAGTLAVGGATASAAGRSVLLEGQGNVVSTGPIAAATTVTVRSLGGDAAITSASGTTVGVTANGAATVAGAVTAAGDYTVDGASVTLGTTGASTTQTATGNTLIRASSTTPVAARGNLALTATGTLTLDRSLGVMANVTQDDSLALSGSTLSVGDIASTAGSAVGTGDVSLTATTGDLTAGALAARRAITATATLGNATIGGATSGGAGDVTVGALNGAAAVTGDVGSSGNYGVTARSVTLGGVADVLQTAGGTATIRATAGGIAKGAGDVTLAAAGNVALQADGAIAFTDVRSGGTAAIGGATGLNALSVTGAGVRAAGTIAVNATNAISLTGTTAVERRALDTNLVDFSGAASVADFGVTIASATGAVTAGTLGATGDIAVTAAGIATVAGSAAAGDATSTAARSFSVTGSGITLGGGTAATQSATGDVIIRATTGSITTTPSLTIVADSAADGSATGLQRLVLDSAGAITGGATLRAGSTAPATASARSDVLVRLASGSALALGAITADQFALVDGAYAPLTANSVVTSGAISLGAVDTVQSTTIGATGGPGARDVAIAGVTSATGGVTVFSNTGTVTLTGAVTAATAASLTANGATGAALTATSVTANGGSATVSATLGDVSVGAVDASTAATLTSGGTLTSGTVTARGGAAALTGTTAIVAPAATIAARTNVSLLSNGAIGFDAIRAGGSVTLGDAIGSADSITGTSVRANGGIAVTSNAAITSSSGLVVEANTIDTDLGGFGGAPTGVPSNLTLRSTGGAVTADTLVATGDASVTSDTSNVTIAGATAANVAVNAVSGTALVAGAVTASGDFAVDAATVALGTTGATAAQAAAGTVLVRARTGGITTFGTTTLVADSGGAGGRRLVLDSAGAIGAGGAVGDAPLSLRAGAAGAPASGTSSDILIRLGAPASAVVLGDIDANTLTRTGAGPGYAPFTAASVFVADGGVTLGNVRTVGSTTIGSTTGPVTTGSVASASGGVTLNADAGSLASGAVTALTTASLTAGTTLAVTGDVSGGQAVALTGGTSITVPGSITAGTALASTAGVTLTAPVLTLGTTGAARAITAPGAITLTRTGGLVAISTFGDYGIASTGGAVALINGDLTGGSVVQDDSLALTGTRVAVGTIGSTAGGSFGSGDVVLTATGSSSGDGVTAGAVTARTDVVASAVAGNITAGAVNAGAGVGVTATAGSIATSAIDAGEAVALTAGTSITVPGSITAGTALASTAGVTLTAPVLTLGTTAAVRSITAPGAITLTRTDGPVAIATRGDYSIASSGGAVALVNADLSGGAVDQTDSLALSGLRVVVGSIGSTPAAPGDLVGSGDVALTATGPLALDGVTAGGIAARANVLATATAGSIGVGAIAAGQGVALTAGTTITAPESIAAGTVLASTAGVTLTAPVLTLGTTAAVRSITAPGAITLTRAGGPVAITTRGDYAVTSSGGAVSLVNGDGSGATVTQTDSLALTGTRVLVGAILSVPAAPGDLVGSGTVRLAATGPLVSDSVIAGDIASRDDVEATSVNGTVTLGAVTATNLTVSSGGAPVVVTGPVAASGNYSVSGTTVTLGTAGQAFALGAAGSVAITATTGAVTALGTGGILQSNVGGTRTGAAGGLTITGATGIAASTIDIVANRAVSTPDPLTGVAQSAMPGVTLGAGAAGGGSIAVRSVTGGAVTVAAPGTIDLRAVTASDDVAITGSAVSGNDTATVAPLAITIDGAGVLGTPAPVSVTVAGGSGAEVTSLGVANSGRVGTFALLTDTGAATLRGLPTVLFSSTPALPFAIDAVRIESQTGIARIVNPSATNAFTAGSVTVRGRRSGSTALVSGPLLTSGGITVTGPTATLGAARSIGGDILVAATGPALLATGAGETATATAGSITVASSTGLAQLGAGVAGATIAVTGTTATIDRSATAGDDVVVTGATVTLGTATIASTGVTDLQAGDDTAILTRRGIATEAGTGYGASATVLGDAAATIASASTGGAVRMLGGSNVVVTSGSGLALGGTILTAARDLRVEAAGGLVVGGTTGSASVGRDLLAAAATTVTAAGAITAGGDLVLLASGGALDASGATLAALGAAGSAGAIRADGTIALDPVGGGAIGDLGGSNIVLAASGPVTLGTATTGPAPTSLRVSSGGAVTAQSALTISGDIVLAGSSVTTLGLTAGDDIVLIARSGAALADGALTTSGAAATDAPLLGLAGGSLALDDGTPVGRVEGSSIVVAANGTATLPGAVTSAGRYTVIGRGGVALGTAGSTVQQAARDILVDASTGIAALPASVTLAGGMTLAANSDGVELAAATPGRFVAEDLVIGLGNGSLDAGAATVRAGRTATATLADQGRVIVGASAPDGVKSIAIATLDSASASLRALNVVTIGTATIDAGLTLASKAGAASLGTLAIGTGVPLMTTPERNAIDLGIFGSTGATLGSVTGTTARDITIATAGGAAAITGAAAARDDIVVTSTTGTATANTLSFTGSASDSEASGSDPARDADGVALIDPYARTGPTITGLNGRQIVVAGGTGASLVSVTNGSPDAGRVSVLTAGGPATLGSVAGPSLVADVIVATRGGTASITSLENVGNVTLAGTTTTIATADTTGRMQIDAGVGGATLGTVTASQLAVTSGGTVEITSAETLAADARITAAGPATIGRLVSNDAIAITAGSATLGAALTGLVAARTNLTVTSPGAVTIGTARAGGILAATGASLTATTLEAGDAIAATATAGAASIATATTTGRPLTTDYTGFATTGSAAPGTRGITIAARDFATLTTGSAQGGIAVTGDAAIVTTATADLAGVGGDLVVTGRTLGALLGTGAGRDVVVTTTGDSSAEINRGVASRDLTVSAATTIAAPRAALATLTSGEAGRTITVRGSDAVIARATANRGSGSGNDGDLIVTTVSPDAASGGGRAEIGFGSGRDVRVIATGDLTIDSITATRDVAASAAFGTASVTAVTAGHEIFVTGTAVDVGTATANTGGGDGDLTISAGGTGPSAGSVALGFGSGRRVRVFGGGLTTIERAEASLDVSVVGDTIVVDTALASHSIMLNSTGTIDATTLTANLAGGSGIIYGTTDSADSSARITIGTASGYDVGFGGGSTRVTSAEAVNKIDIFGGVDATLGTGSAGGDLFVVGGTVTVGTATADASGTGGDLLIAAGGGGATFGSGTGRDIRVTATSGGSATVTDAAATRDLFVDVAAGAARATLTTGTAGRDAVVVGPSVAIGTLTAGDDIAVVATGGLLTATTLSSTGTDALDAVAGLVAADGSALVDPLSGTAIGSLGGGGNVMVLAQGDISVGTVTATAPAAATAPGLVRLAASGSTQVTTATATAGDIAVAGAAIDATTVSAGRDITAAGGSGGIRIATVATARDVTLTSAGDLAITGTATLARDLGITATRDIAVGASAAPGATALAVGGKATLTAGRNLTVLRRITTGGTLLASAGGAMSLAGFASGAATLLAGGNLDLVDGATATGALAATSSGGAIAATALTGGGITLTAANGVTVAGATTSSAGFAATGGTLRFAAVGVTGDAALRARGAIDLGGVTTGGAFTATADTGTVTTGGLASGGAATVTATTGGMTLASLTSGAAATLRAGAAIDAGAVRATGAATLTSDAATMRLASLDAGGTATLRARGDLTVTGSGRAGGALDALSSAGAVRLGAATAGTTAALRGATGLTVTGATAATGAVTATADTGALATGDIAGGDVTVTATAGSATIASVSRAARLAVTASTAATVTGAVTASGAYTVTAPQITLGGGRQASGGTTTLASADLVLGAGLTLAAPTRVQLNVTGAATGVSLGDGAGAAAAANRYTLSRAELATIATPTLEIDAVARPVDFGDTALPNVTAAFGVRTTGDIRVADRLAFDTASGTARVLTLGGVAGGANLDKTTPTANSVRVLARSTLDNAAANTGGQILAGGSTVQLRATYIALGETPSPDAGRAFIDELLPSSGTPLDTPVVRSSFLNNSGSTLYSALPLYTKQTPAPQVLVRSGTLVLAAGKWALIQNTGPTAQPGGGIEVTSLQLNRLGGAAAPDPVIGVFGGIAAKTGIVAAVSVSADQLDGISPNNIRINGCVALSTGGCIQSNVAIPLINLADPGRNLLISNAPDLALSIELITGATNEALWREDDDPAPNRPQSESRP